MNVTKKDIAAIVAECLERNMAIAKAGADLVVEINGKLYVSADDMKAMHAAASNNLGESLAAVFGVEQ